MSHTIARNPDEGQRRLAKDIGTIVSDAEKVLLHAGIRADGTHGDTQTRLQRSVDHARSQLARLQDEAAHSAANAADTADHYIRANPWKSLGFVAALSLLAGVVIARNTEA